MCSRNWDVLVLTKSLFAYCLLRNISLFSDKLAETKTGLQEDDFEITKQLRRVKLHYDHLYQIVHDLSQKFGCYMYSYRPALIRYIKLKSMITECIQRYSEKIETLYDTLDTTKGTQALMQKNAEINIIMSGR